MTWWRPRIELLEPATFVDEVANLQAVEPESFWRSRMRPTAAEAALRSVFTGIV